MAWKVLFFQTARGDFPVRRFIEEQDKAIQSKLYELRISGKVEIRIFYTIANNEYYLLHAFKKKSRKTPSKELKVALDRMKEIV